MNPYLPAFAWQSHAVLARHVRVHLRNWYTATLPPVCEPLIMLLAFGVGLGRQIGSLTWEGASIDYMHYLAPGILAYTAFMSSFFQSLFGAYIRMHFQKSWEGQLTTQVRLEHVVWGEALWAATLATAYASGCSLLESTMLANIAAGIVVGKIGTATVASEELIRSFGR